MPNFKIREADIDDIKQIQIVRNSVTENTLSDSSLVTDKGCETFLTKRGKGWVCEVQDEIIGFSIVDLQEKNVWVLFLKAAFEGLGIGKNLQSVMLDWYFSQTGKNIWLGTSPGTRAKKFYRKSGWLESGRLENGEIKFQMSRSRWMRKLNP